MFKRCLLLLPLFIWWSLAGVALAYNHLEIVTSGGESDETQSVGFSVIVTARNPDGTIDAGAYPLVSFTSSDPNASLPPNSYLSGGQATFNNLVLNTPGDQTITVSDYYDPTVLEGTLPLNVHRFVDHFDFVIPHGAKSVGVPFQITIVAKDNTGATNLIFSDNVSLSASVGEISPSSVLGSSFTNGEATLMVTLYGTDLITHINSITCTNNITYPGQPQTPSGTSENFTISPGSYSTIILLFPGESLTPGSAPGKSGEPTQQVAGVSFSEVKVKAVDEYWNPVSAPPYPTISFSSTDTLATLPPLTPMTSNSESFSNLVLRTAGSQTVIVEEDIDHNTNVSTILIVHNSVNHFSFAQIPSPQTTITPFNVSITARDAFENRVYSFNSDIALESSTGPYTYTPTLVTLTSGVWTGLVHVTKKANNGYLTCDDLAGHTGRSNDFTINAGPFSELLIVLPGETYTPGISPGRSNPPTEVQAGEMVTATIRAVDEYWNQVAGSSVLVPISISSSTGYIESLDDGAQLTQFGIGDYRVIFRTYHGQRIRAVNGFNTDMDDLSSTITVHSGPYRRLVLAAPGESLNPGTFEPDGKSGSPEDQMAGNEFQIEVAVTDSYWNPIEDPPPYPVVDFTTNDPQATLPTGGEPMGSPVQEYEVTLATVGLEWLKANDSNEQGKEDLVNIKVTAGPLDHFDFSEISSPQQVGEPIYNIRVTARDGFGNQVLSFNQEISLLSSTGEGTFSPSSIALTNGEWVGTVTIYRAGPGVELSCEDGMGHSGSSNPFDILAGSYSKLLITLPGQEYIPGVAPGKSGSATSTTAGVSITATVRAVDQYWNLIPAQPTVDLSTSGYAVIPGNDSRLNPDGTREFQILFRTAGINSVMARDVNDTLITDASSIFVSPTDFANIQLLAPGESPDPGSPTGKVGPILPQTTGIIFDCVVRAVDEYWNLVPTINGEHIRLSSSDNSLNDNNPPNQGQSFVNGEITFSIYLAHTGLISVTASDLDDMNKTQTVAINVHQGAYYQVITPDTVTAGPPANFPMTVRLVDPQTGEPVNASHGFFLTPLLANHDPTDGVLGVTSSILDSGVAVIAHQTYDKVENICIRIWDDYSREVFSNTISVLAADVFYQVTVPERATVGPPRTFPVTVELRDAQTGNPITTEDREVKLTIYSAASGEPGSGVTDVTTVNLIQGRASIQESYTKVEDIYIVATDTLGVRGTSSVFPVDPDGYKKLQIIAPGETPQPGSISESGKSGSPNPQRAGVPFTVLVRAVDQYWNLADTTQSGKIHLNSSDNSLNEENPPDQNQPFVNGERILNIFLSNAGFIEVTASDLSDPAKLPQTVPIEVREGPHYQITVPDSALAGPPATFFVVVKLVDPQTGEPVSSSNSFTMTPFLANYDPAHGVLGKTSATLNNGSVAIVDQTYNTVEDIVIRVDDDYGRQEYSEPIHIISGGFYYQITVPDSAAVGPPSSFPVRITLRDVNTNAIAVTENRELSVVLYSAKTGTPGTGSVGVSQVNLGQGEADFLQTYTKAEDVFIRVSDSLGLSAVSPVFSLSPDGYKKLQLVAPGEVAEPGSISPTGKSGLPLVETSDVPFVVTAIAVDQYWNLVDVNDGRVHISSSDSSLNGTNPLNQNSPFTNGKVDFEIILHQQGQVRVTVEDLSNVEKTPQSVDIPVNAATYEITLPTTAVAGPPATFPMTLKLINPATGGVISASHSFTLTPFKANHDSTDGNLLVKSGLLDNGVALINDQAYDRAEVICIRVRDYLGREAYSSPINIESGGVYYTVTVPDTAAAGPPERFPVTIRLLDANTGNLVTTDDGAVWLRAYSASSGLPGEDTLGVGVAQLIEGTVTIQQSYGIAEHIYIKVWDNEGLEAVSPPFLVVAGREASLMVTANPVMEGGQTSPLVATLTDAHGNYISKANLLFSVLGGPGSLNSPSAITNALGQASVELTAWPGSQGIIVVEVKSELLSKLTEIQVLGPPLTTMSFDGLHIELGDVVYIKPATQIILSSSSQIGVDTIYYSLDQGDWQVYGEPFSIEEVGSHLVRYYGVDIHGNREGVKPSKKLSVSQTLRGKINNYPNPFRAGSQPTHIEYLLQEASDVTLTIYDLLGEVVWRMEFKAGEHGGEAGVNLVEWWGRNGSGKVVGNGGYICLIKSKREELKRKIGVVK